MSHCRGRALRLFGPTARNDRGATAVEYALMVTLIAVAIIGGVVAFGSSVNGLFQFIVASRPFG